MSKNSDYIPGADADSLVWMRNFSNFALTKGVTLGLSGVQASNINSAFLDFEASIRDLAAAEAALAEAVQAKLAKRAAVQKLIRAARGIMAPNLTQALRAEAGLTVLDSTATPVGPPTVRPTARVDTSQALQHTIRLADHANPTRRSRPQGASHAEVWLKIGDPKPAGPEEMRYVGFTKSAKYLHTFEGSDAGKMAHYLFRWTNAKNQPGPWSELHSATIAGI